MPRATSPPSSTGSWTRSVKSQQWRATSLVKEGFRGFFPSLNALLRTFVDSRRRFPQRDVNGAVKGSLVETNPGALDGALVFVMAHSVQWLGWIFADCEQKALLE